MRKRSTKYVWFSTKICRGCHGGKIDLASKKENLDKNGAFNSGVVNLR